MVGQRLRQPPHTEKSGSDPERTKKHTKTIQRVKRPLKTRYDPTKRSTGATTAWSTNVMNRATRSAPPSEPSVAEAIRSRTRCHSWSRAPRSTRPTAASLPTRPQSSRRRYDRWARTAVATDSTEAVSALVARGAVASARQYHLHQHRPPPAPILMRPILNERSVIDGGCGDVDDGDGEKRQ